MKKLYLLVCALFVASSIAIAQPVTVMGEQFAGNNAGGVEGSTIIGDAGVWHVVTSAQSPATCFWKWTDASGQGIPQGHGGDDVNRITCYSTNAGASDSWVFSPAVQMQANVEYTITFWTRKVGSADATMEAWVGTNISDLTSGTTSSVATLTTSYVKTTRLFTPTNSGTYYLGFHCNSPAAATSGVYYAILDDIKIEAELAGGNAGVTAIIAPIDGTNLGNQSVSVEIKNFGDAEISNVPVGFRVDGGAPLTEVYSGTLAPNATAIFNFAQTADLSVAGAHVIKCWTDLAGDILVANDTLAKTVVNTPCDVIDEFPYDEGFEATVLPDCWLRYRALFGNATVNAASMTIDNTNDVWKLTNANQGLSGNHIIINNYGVNINSWLVTPPIELPANNNLQLTFDLALTAWNLAEVTAPAQTNGDDDRFMVVVSTDGGASWNIANATVWDNAGAANVYNNIATQGEEVAINLSQYSGNVKIAFYAESTESNADNNIHIDNIKIANIPTCFKPTEVTATEVTHNSANIAWTAAREETAWNVVVSPTPLANPAAATSYPVTENSYLAEGLNTSTVYYVYVQSDCGNGDVSEWTGAVTFMTTQQPTTLPYEPTFATNDNWTFTNTDETINRWFIGSTSDAPEYATVTNGLYISYDDGYSNGYIENEPTTNYAYRTLYFDRAGTVKVSFQWRANGNDANYDFMRAFLVPTDVMLQAGDRPTLTGDAPDGWIDLMNGELGQMQTTYQTIETEISIEDAKNMNLVFYWTNNNTMGDVPAASVINLKVKYKVALTVESSSVHNGDTNIPIDEPITVTLSDLVNINGEPNLDQITLASGANAIDATVTYANATITITPAAALAQGTEYTLTISAGAIVGLDEEIAYTFTTARETGVDNIQTAEIHISPTVTDGDITIIAPAGSTLKIVDLAGRILSNRTLTNCSQTIHLNYFAGTYLVIVENKNTRKIEKIILK